MSYQFIKVKLGRGEPAEYFLNEDVNVTRNLRDFAELYSPYEIPVLDGDEETYLTVIPRCKMREMFSQLALKALVATLKKSAALKRNDPDLLNELNDYVKLMTLVVNVMKDENAVLAII